MHIRKLSLLAGAAVALMSATQVHAQTSLLADGDFEAFASQVANGGYTTIQAGSSLGAWSVTGSSVDLIRNAYGAITDVSVDLAGTPGPGYISQTFNAVAGTTYTLAWDYFKNPPGAQLDVSFGGATTNYGVANGVTHATLDWTATTSGIQTVSFGTGSTSNQGPTVDNIMLTVSAVPEPQSLALLAAGLACLAWLTRRRKQP